MSNVTINCSSQQSNNTILTIYFVFVGANGNIIDVFKFKVNAVICKIIF